MYSKLADERVLELAVEFVQKQTPIPVGIKARLKDLDMLHLFEETDSE